MAWSYQVRGSKNRLVQLRTGFLTEKRARDAGQRTKRMIDCICFPNPETLTVITKEVPDGQPISVPKMNLKYPWQQGVLDAFMEPNAKTMRRKISIAERAICARLLDSPSSKPEERVALRESLLALRRLLHQLAHHNEESREKEETA